MTFNELHEAYMNMCDKQECDDCKYNGNFPCQLLYGYDKGRADQKEEDNAFFNFEGAWDIEKKKVRADVIDEFAEDIINKINFEEKWLLDCKSNNADTNIMISGLKTFVKSLAEKVKEQK